MTETPTAAPAGNPHLSVEEVGKRFLRLLDSIHTRDDITKERVEEVMGLKLSPSFDGKFYGVEQNISDGWIWAVNYFPEGIEPISKLPEQQKYRRNLYKSEEILGM